MRVATGFIGAKLAAAAAAALALGAPSAEAAKSAVAGVVTAAYGKPEVKRSGEERFERVKINAFVYEGDTLRTKRREMVALAFVGGAEMRINEESVFLVEKGGGIMPSRVRTRIGQAWTRLLHGRAQVEIATSQAVASVRGTEADVEAGDRMTVKVYDGYVNVSNEHGSQDVSAGQMTQVGSQGAAPEAPRAMTAADRDPWFESIKPSDVEGQVDRLNKEAERVKELEIESGGKKIKLKFEKK